MQKVDYSKMTTTELDKKFEFKTDQEWQNEIAEMAEDCYPTVKLFSYEGFNQAELLKAIDEHAYKELFLEYIESVNVDLRDQEGHEWQAFRFGWYKVPV